MKHVSLHVSILLIFSFLLAPFSYSEDDDIYPEEIIALVDGKPIYRIELESRLARYPEEMRESMRQEVLEGLIMGRLIRKAAGEKGIDATQEEIDQVVASGEYIGPDIIFDYTEALERILSRKLMDELFDLSVSDDEVKEYYDFLFGPDSNVPYDTVASELMWRIFEEQTMNEWREFAQSLRDESDIFIFPDAVPPPTLEDPSQRNHPPDDLVIPDAGDDVLAWSDGEPFITADEFNRRVSEFPQSLYMPVEEARQKILQMLIDERLLAMEAEGRGYMSDADITGRIAEINKDILKAHKLTGLDTEITEDDLRNYYLKNWKQFIQIQNLPRVKFVVFPLKEEAEEFLNTVRHDEAN